MTSTSADPRDWFDGVPRVLFVHAHPDDETIATGGTLAALAAAGQEPLLITCTRGELGEARPGPFAHLPGTDALAPHRMQELAAAIAMLGVERHAFLGVPPARAAGLPPTIYEDSGMAWGPDGRAVAGDAAGADALTRVPAFEALADLLAAADESGARAIVSYDDGGGYGHPDHVFAHRMARAVAQALDLPFWVIAAESSNENSGSGDGPADLDHSDLDSEPADSEPADSEPAGAETAGGSSERVAAEPVDGGVAEPAEHQVQAYDISPWIDRKIAALRAHQTQLEVDGDDIVHVGGQRQPIARIERFVRM